jgi:uncharacterized protein
VTFEYHGVPPSVFGALAEGGGGPEALSLLAAAQYSKHQLLLERVLHREDAVNHGQQKLTSRGYDLLAEVQRCDPEAAGVVIRHPSVAAWAARTLKASRNGSGADAEPHGLCAIAAAAAIRVRLPAQIEVPVSGGLVMLPSLGAAAASGDHAVVRVTATGAYIESGGGRAQVPPDPHQDAPGWSGLRRITVGRLDVLMDDLDPFRMPAVPDLASRQSAAQAAMWAAAFHGAWPLLDQHHPAIATEVAALVKVVVPRRPATQDMVSSSSPETFGGVAMSQPTGRRALAVTLAHEVQHIKLSALLDVVTLTRPDGGRRFYAPWRDDPRPVNGLLQGAYAFLGVARFWRGQRDLEHGAAGIEAHAQYARWRAATALAATTLSSSGQLTRAGTEFVNGIQRTLTAWMAEPVPDEARELARRQAEQHRDRWVSANGPIPA